MPEKGLLVERLLVSPAFIRDLRGFLSLREDVLLAISEIGGGPEGFSGRPQAEDLNARFGVPIDEATRVLLLVEHLYDRVTELGLSTSETVSQIASIALGLEEPIEIDTRKRDAIEAVFSFKRDYEIANATSKALDNVPHFVDVNGDWSVKLIRTREGESVKIPVLTMSVIWHDSSLNHRQTTFFLSDEDWSEINTAMKAIADRREEINELL